MTEDSQGAEDVTEKYSLWTFLGVLRDKLHTFPLHKVVLILSSKKEGKKSCQDLISHLKVIFLNSSESEEAGTASSHCYLWKDLGFRFPLGFPFAFTHIPSVSASFSCYSQDYCLLQQ